MEVLAWLFIVLWVIWFAGYPIVRKIRKEDMFDFEYVIVVNVLSVLVSLFNLLRKIL